MEEVDRWLLENRHDCYGISIELKDAIADFVLVWSLFEAKILLEADKRLLDDGTKTPTGTDRGKYELIEDAARRGLADFTGSRAFQDAYAHHRNHYYDGVQFSNHLKHLTQNAGRSNARLRDVFKNKTPPYHLKVAALLHVAYCLRTNLIHGFKWESGLAGQEANFRHATQVLMLAVDHPA